MPGLGPALGPDPARDRPQIGLRGIALRHSFAGFRESRLDQGARRPQPAHFRRGLHGPRGEQHAVAVDDAAPPPVEKALACRGPDLGAVEAHPRAAKTERGQRVDQRLAGGPAPWAVLAGLEQPGDDRIVSLADGHGAAPRDPPGPIGPDPVRADRALQMHVEQVDGHHERESGAGPLVDGEDLQLRIESHMRAVETREIGHVMRSAGDDAVQPGLGHEPTQALFVEERLARDGGWASGRLVRHASGFRWPELSSHPFTPLCTNPRVSRACPPR